MRKWSCKRLCFPPQERREEEAACLLCHPPLSKLCTGLGWNGVLLYADLGYHLPWLLQGFRHAGCHLLWPQGCPEGWAPPHMGRPDVTSLHDPAQWGTTIIPAGQFICDLLLGPTKRNTKYCPRVQVPQ